eukprot:6189461-Pleurochrysis_carterae.AAC.3
MDRLHVHGLLMNTAIECRSLFYLRRPFMSNFEAAVSAWRAVNRQLVARSAYCPDDLMQIGLSASTTDAIRVPSPNVYRYVNGRRAACDRFLAAMMMLALKYPTRGMTGMPQ